MKINHLLTLLLIFGGSYFANAQDVIINEIMAINSSVLADEDGGFPDWIELANTSGSSIDLDGWYVSDSIGSPTLWQLNGPNGEFIIPAGGYLVLYADGDTTAGVYHTNFRLSGSGEDVVLANPTGTIIDQLTYGQQYADNSLALIQGVWTITNSPTPNAANEVAQSFAGKLQLNEIMVRNDKVIADEYGRFVDWIELKNVSNESIDLAGFFLSDDRLDLGQFTIEGRADTTIMDPASFQLIWADDSVELGENHANFKLSGTGETVYFSQVGANGILEIIDSIAYPQMYPGISFGRDADGSNWIYQPYSSPLATNVGQPVSFAGMIKLNEYMVDNDSVYYDPFNQADDWIELYNASNQTVNTASLFLTDTVGDLFKWRIGSSSLDSTAIGANGFQLIFADNSPQQGLLHADYKLSNSGEELYLIQLLNGDTLILDQTSYTTTVEDMSHGRTVDGAGNWELQSCFTPGEENHPMQEALAGRLYINEILASNKGVGFDNRLEYDDWVELYNASDSPIDLSGLLLSDTLGELDKYVLPCDRDSLIIGAHETFILWADKSPEQGVAHVGIGLSSTDEIFVISQVIGMDTLIVDSMSFPEQFDDISYGRQPNGGAEIDYFADPTFNASNEPAVVGEESERLKALLLRQGNRLQLKNGETATWSVYSLNGSVVQQHKGDSINLDGFDGGLYLVSVQIGRQQMYKKMVVNR